MVWLREKNISIDTKDKEGRTAFFESCYEGHWDTAFACLEYGASPNCYIASTSLQTEHLEEMIKKAMLILK